MYRLNTNQLLHSHHCHSSETETGVPQGCLFCLLWVKGLRLFIVTLGRVLFVLVDLVLQWECLQKFPASTEAAVDAFLSDQV